jgi:hypothetical protein
MAKWAAEAATATPRTPAKILDALMKNSSF